MVGFVVWAGGYGLLERERQGLRMREDWSGWREDGIYDLGPAGVTGGREEGVRLLAQCWANEVTGEIDGLLRSGHGWMLGEEDVFNIG